MNLPDQADRDRLLQNGIRMSAAKGFSQVYNTLGQSCESTLFDLLDQSLRYGKTVAPFRLCFGELFEPAEEPLTDALRLRGLIGDSSSLPTLNQETGGA